MIRFVTSAELKNLAMNLATDTLLGHFGKSTNKISKELKTSATITPNSEDPYK